MSTEKPNHTLLMLARKWLAGKITVKEKAEFDQWYNSFDDSYHELTTAETAQFMENRIKQAILTKAGIAQTKTKSLWPRVGGIAAAVAAITLGVWLYYTSNLNGRHSDPALSSRVSRDLNDIAPGGNKATIKFGDGEAITLSDQQTGVIVGVNNLTYTDNTDVITGSDPSSRGKRSDERFSSAELAKGSVLPYGRDDGRVRTLTVSTPRGGTYQITLPDGTKVWLNAASVLTYTMPLNERGGIRQVKLSGEAYFEVFRNKKQPFVVTTKNLTTTVLGTHFNISAYDDENSTKATLLEGSVRVTTLSSRANAKDLDSSYPRNDKGVSNDERSLPAVRDEGSNVTLSPNQQATATAHTSITVKQVDASTAIDWKNGNFVFKGESLESILKKVARWYDVEIMYATGVDKQALFGGYVSRSLSISSVLELMSRTGKVKFEIEGKKIIVRQ